MDDIVEEKKGEPEQKMHDIVEEKKEEPEQKLDEDLIMPTHQEEMKIKKVRIRIENKPGIEIGIEKLV